MSEGNYKDAITSFTAIADFKDSAQRIKECKYKEAEKIRLTKVLLRKKTLPSQACGPGMLKNPPDLTSFLVCPGDCHASVRYSS